MASLVLNGNTSGSVTISSPAVSGTTTLTLPASSGTVTVAGVNSNIVSGTAVASTSGTSIDFTGIPSWVKRITVMFSGVSTNGTSIPLFQLGDSGGVETTGYLSAASAIAANTVATVNNTTGIAIYSVLAANILHGDAVFTLVSGNTWAATSSMSQSNSTVTLLSSGTKTLSSTLDRIRITTTNGTDTFDAGSINILYE